MFENYQYGYMTPETNQTIIQMKPGQNIAGFPIGIIYIDCVSYPMLPGNVVNGYTYPFPVRLMPVEGLKETELFNTEPQVKDMVLKAALKLQSEGCRAVTGACGFFGNYQKFLARSLDIPAAMSSLMQIPWILPILKPDQKIAVLTANKASITPHLLRDVGITEEMESRLVIKDLRHEKEFSAILEDRGYFDNSIVTKEVVGKAKEAVEEYPKIGAVVLECSDMPPYACAVQSAVQLPVFDFITLIKWMYNSVAQTPYTGFI
ncbi:MAG: aspartate/glutamate racemase family protein [Lachnospiraceae bacterium]|nr:MAG: aspartate/glutamate racemase family protein [Lachnospiraceae bacterium]